GVYWLTARAVDKSGGITSSAPVAVRVGNPERYRAVMLAGSGSLIDGLPWDGSGSRNLVIKGEPTTRADLELSPPVDAARAALLRSFVHTKEGTSVTLSGLPPGSYEVYLYVVADGPPETYDLLIKGKLVQSQFASGPSGRWERAGPWFVDVSDGVLDLAARGGEANFSGLEVWRVK
ncbi:MAG TPA: hypothetical protein VEN81_12375, partial [Planctomycetota bacterium]|nr:hypothetical protein [Planctomycetota bacterium]